MSKLIFRAHSWGKLLGDKKGTSFTESMQKELDGLNDRILSGKKLTEIQSNKMAELKKRKKAPDELSDTAKTYVRELWLQHEKGIRTYHTNKFMEKGLYNESDAISLIKKVDEAIGMPYYQKMPDDGRKSNGVVSGLCDILVPNYQSKKIVMDTKCTWNATTFMNAGHSTIYEAQGDAYMELYDADEFWLRYVLTDLPPHMMSYERMKFMLSNNISDEDDDKVIEFEQSLIYDNNLRLTSEERVKTIIYKRDESRINKLYDKVKLALDYYPTIKFNEIY